MFMLAISAQNFQKVSECKSICISFFQEECHTYVISTLLSNTGNPVAISGDLHLKLPYIDGNTCI